jgi:hypothetical protein
MQVAAVQLDITLVLHTHLAQVEQAVVVQVAQHK